MSEGILTFDGINSVGPNMAGAVYLWTYNGIPCYVGYTTKSIFGRIKNHLKDGPARLFQNKLRARKENFRCYIIHWSNMVSKLKEMEIYFINKFNTFYDDNKEFGMNLTRGGDGIVVSDKTREKLSKSRTGKSTGPLSKEHKQAISLSLIGKKHTEDVKAKLSILKLGVKHTQEHKDNISAACKGRVSNRKGVTLSEETKQKMRGKRKQFSEDTNLVSA